MANFIVLSILLIAFSINSVLMNQFKFYFIKLLSRLPLAKFGGSLSSLIAIIGIYLASTFNVIGLVGYPWYIHYSFLTIIWLNTSIVSILQNYLNPYLLQKCYLSNFIQASSVNWNILLYLRLSIIAKLLLHYLFNRWVTLIDVNASKKSFSSLYY